MLTREAAALELASGNRLFLFYLSLASRRGPTRICGRGAMRIFRRRAPTNWHFYCHCLKLTQGGERSYWRGSPAAASSRRTTTATATTQLQSHKSSSWLPRHGSPDGGRTARKDKLFVFTSFSQHTHLTITVKCEWHTEAKINSLMAEHEEWWLIRYIFTEERSRDWAIPRKYSLEIRVL